MLHFEPQVLTLVANGVRRHSQSVLPVDRCDLAAELGKAVAHDDYAVTVVLRPEESTELWFDVVQRE